MVFHMALDDSAFMLMPKNVSMVGSGGYWEGFVNGVPDDILNILDFPMESLEGDSLEDWDAQFQRLGPIPLEVFQELAPVSQVNIGNGKSAFRPNNCVPSDTTSELKQLPDVVEEISSTSIPLDSSHAKESSLFQTPTTISVLESCSSCSGDKSISCSGDKSMSTSPELLVPVRTRSKRPRCSTLSKWTLISPITFSKWPLISPRTPSEKILNRKGKEKKKKKLSQLSDDLETKENYVHQPIQTKRCTHCQITQTPQWREGPMGPKTLCNACGVRYRSGHLFPEYRPAASPTFVPSLHSNSHKKVIEMRNKPIQKYSMPQMDLAMSPPPDCFPQVAPTYLVACKGVEGNTFSS